MFPRGGITYYPNKSPRQEAVRTARRGRAANDTGQPANNRAEDLQMLLRLGLLVAVAVAAVTLITSLHG